MANTLCVELDPNDLQATMKSLTRMRDRAQAQRAAAGDPPSYPATLEAVD
jgi:hypothetical protein